MQQEKRSLSKIKIPGRSQPVFQNIKTYGLVLILLSAGSVMPPAGTETSHVLVPPIVRQCSAEEHYAVTVHRDESFRTTTYRVSKGKCTVEWIARDVEPGVIKHRAVCLSPIGLQLPLMKRLCAEFLRNDPNAPVLRTLFWGRLEPDQSNASWEMSYRMALAAYHSSGWDVRRGKPKNGDMNGFVRDLANRSVIYPELKELFESFHRNIRFSCAEKVLVQKAGKLPFYDHLKARGVGVEDKLPFDCMTWFSISEK